MLKVANWSIGGLLDLDGALGGNALAIGRSGFCFFDCFFTLDVLEDLALSDGWDADLLAWEVVLESSRTNGLLTWSMISEKGLQGAQVVPKKSKKKNQKEDLNLVDSKGNSKVLKIKKEASKRK